MTLLAADERRSAGPTGTRVSNATITGKRDSINGKWVAQLVVLRPSH